MYLEKAKVQLEQLQFRTGDLVPCTPDEVQALEHRIGHVFPAAYREFLLWAGRSFMPLRGSEYTCQSLPHLQKDVVEWLQEDGFPQALPADAFVFLTHQGYAFTFFRFGEGDDPAVYSYMTGMKENNFKRDYEHLSELVLAVSEAHVKYRAEVARRIMETAKHNPARARKMAAEARQRGDYP